MKLRETSMGLSGQERRTTHQRVRDELRRAIFGGLLPGGTRLVQAEVAEQLGVSTTPVREAMRDLASEGLIEFDAYRGAVVASPSLDEVREIYELRLVLEPLAIRKAVEHMTPEELDRAEEIQRQLDKERDPGVWVDLNRQFHAVFDNATRSPRISAMLQNLRESAAIVVGLSVRARPIQMASGNRDHRALLQACRKRDADLAVRVLKRHFQSTLEAVDRYFEDSAALDSES